MWDKHSIIAEVHRRGGSLSAIARNAGLTRTACSCALAGRRWPKAEQAIARFLGVPVSQLFPDRYGATSGAHHSRRQRVRKVKNQQRTLTARRQRPDREAA